LLVALLVLLAALWNLGGPAPWWDEGWTLSVARNWVELGHYGRLLGGQPSPPGLEAAFPVTAPIALSFEIFGVGIWQGRLPIVLFMLAALALMYYLALRLYNRRVALGTLFVLLFMPMHADLHPLRMGRQVLAEMPMLCYLLGGYACLLPALRRSPWWLLAAAALWGIGLDTKLQALPFWALSLLVPLAVALLRRRWRLAGTLGGGLLGAWGLAWLLPPLVGALLRGHTLPVVPIGGLYNVLALVVSPLNRVIALQGALIFGLPTVGGLAYAAWRWLKARGEATADAGAEAVRLALLTFSASWLGWYVCLSVGLPRYLFPALFVGSIFAAAWLADLSDGYNLAATLDRLGAALRARRMDRRAAGALVALLVVFAGCALTLPVLYRHYTRGNDDAAQQVAALLNVTPPGTRIETYESELHFLLNRPYHFPPDQVHVELNRRSLLHEDITIAYEPLASDPDYLVVGVFTRWNKLYDPVVASGAFRLVERYGHYDVYRRVR
jgi:4-amino-4-deoxy-L-arabinose transferase-like glycosyltransferase